MSALTDALDVTYKTDLSFFVTPGGDIGRVSGLQNLYRALNRRLMTIPGSLVHRPGYGVGLGSFQNGLNSFSNQQKLAASIQEQFEQDPRVETVTGVSIQYDDNSPELVKIAVTLTPVGYTEQVMVFAPFSGVAA